MKKKRIMVEFEELDTVNGVKDKNDTGLLDGLPRHVQVGAAKGRS